MRRRLVLPLVLLATAVLAPAALAPAATAVEPGPRVEHIALGAVPTARDASREVRTDRPFSMLGVRWTGAAPDEVAVRARTDRGWRPWTPLEPATDRASEPLWTGDARAAQVRATRDGRDVTAELQLIALDPGPAPAARQAPAAGPGGRPPVVERAGWGADEKQTTWAGQATTTRAVAVHHTAGSNDYRCAVSASVVRGLFHYHAVELGWGDIGYHALVDKCGTVFEGRRGGLDGDVIGGHALGFNHETFGVAMLGNLEQVRPSPETLGGVARISGWKLDRAGVPADGTVVLTGRGGSLHAAGARVALPTIFGHRDVGRTLCPGRFGHAALGEIRSRATAAQHPPAQDPPAQEPPAQESPAEEDDTAQQAL
ncbi:N-acetylmuramoyl-L-alanine amidase [Saccharopolyspora sp. CA-218241]|uniref:N-acetylmuramoyl-L-alanine amidase n=1 Tax=Saccharopolyspora sp. CA-218241 TaxID=3240027 RepID=UPI003D960DA1